MTIPDPDNQIDLRILQGSRFRMLVQVVVDWMALPFTGFAARGQIRSDRSSAGTLDADLSSYLSLDTATGILTIDIPADASSVWTFTTSVYDIEIYTADATKTVRVMQGKIRLDREVAR